MDGSHVVRLVEGRRGSVNMRTQLVIRFDYGSAVPWVTHMQDSELRAVSGPDMAVLRAPVSLHGEGLTSVAEFTIHAGETVPFYLTYGPSHLPPPDPIDPLAALAQTQAMWEEWSARCRHTGKWHDAVLRSHITLKALTYRPTGGIVAAPTTSLPEQLGGARNWDYRFCWLRDATFTLLSLMDAGYQEEACAWRDWLLRAAAGSPSQLQIMYGLAGERRLNEWTADWLPGYEDSRPVRLGNAAHAQLQLDVFGEVMDVLYQARRSGLAGSEAGWALQRALVEHLEQIWNKPDDGIWEVRGGSRYFTHSKVMAWVALDRAVRTIEEFGLDGPVEHWRQLRRTIHQEVCEHGYDAGMGSFVQSYGSKHLDASLLLIPLVGFLPASDDRVSSTLAAIEKQLMADGLVMRYDTNATDDGLPPGEGAFLPCSFWFVDNLVLLGRYDQACRMFDRLLDLRNDVGLLAEEYDLRARRQVGNFPQAFSHVALANTARNLSAAMATRPARQRSG